MSDDWDVDAYKSEFENEEHWQLRRNFMLAHKDKFPEDELVCLAQVFTNIEFMGCRYPEKTMIRVAELAKGVVEKFREERKNSLKRTFVAASDAASAKVKGQTCRREEPVSSKKNKVMVQNVREDVKEAEIVQKKQNKVETSYTRVPKYGGVKTFNIKQEEQVEACPSNKYSEEVPPGEKTNEKSVAEKSDEPLKDFVLILHKGDEHPVSIIQRNSDMNKCTIKWDFKESPNRTFVCKLYLNNHCIASSTGANMKMSKEHTAMVAIAKLRESCYGIRVKSTFLSDTTVSPAQLRSCSNNRSNDLGEDNIGRKLMKLMGWEGGGLGSKGQGREDPVVAGMHVNKKGLGLSSNNCNLVEFREKAVKYVGAWMKGDSAEDLVFSSDFSIEERKILHEIAISFSLKSKSYGKDSNRQLVISRKYYPSEILKDLLKTGGNSDKYELLYPTNNT